MEQLGTDLRTKQLQTSEYIEDVKMMREEISELVSSIESKETIAAELESKVASLPNSINRSVRCSSFNFEGVVEVGIQIVRNIWLD